MPFFNANTGFGIPALRRLCAPMIDRVRPAQFTTTGVSGDERRPGTRYTNSAPGQSTPPGRLTVRNSAIGRASTSTISRPDDNHSRNSAASIRGVSRSCSTISPNAFEMIPLPEKTWRPDASHASWPPTSTHRSV